MEEKRREEPDAAKIFSRKFSAPNALITLFFLPYYYAAPGASTFIFVVWCTFDASFLDLSSNGAKVFWKKGHISSTVLATSVLSPYLFAAHLGSLDTSISERRMVKYADDVVTVVPIQDPFTIDNLIHQLLGDMQLWADENGLKDEL